MDFFVNENKQYFWFHAALVTLIKRRTISSFHLNHDYNKIVKSDWLSTALISALIGQFNWTVRVMPK